MKLRIDIDMQNASFTEGDSFARPLEVARILGDLRRKIVNEGLPDSFRYKLADANGNTVGVARVMRS